MYRTILMWAVLGALAGCGQRVSPESGGGEPSSGHQERIPGIDRMGLDELSRWVRICAPYNGSMEGRARNPYDPMDCDEVQFRHDSWHQPRSQTGGSALPALH